MMDYSSPGGRQRLPAAYGIEPDTQLVIAKPHMSPEPLNFFALQYFFTTVSEDHEYN
jgi:hypothetical protein